MIQYDSSSQTIREWFGEIPDWVSYDQNILQVLNDIQSENGMYYRNRQDVNRDIRNKNHLLRISQMLSRLDTMQKNGKMKILDSCIRKSSASEKK